MRRIIISSLAAAACSSLFFGSLVYRADLTRDERAEAVKVQIIFCQENNQQNQVFIDSIRDGVEGSRRLKIKGYGLNEKERGRRRANVLLQQLAPLDCDKLPERVLRKPPPELITEEEAGSVGHTLPPGPGSGVASAAQPS